MDGSRSRQTVLSRRFKQVQGKPSAARRKRAAKLETLEKRHLLTFAIDLFADINQLGVSSNIDQFVEVGGQAFFVADDGFTGSELWKTDGTVAGTMQVKDILPGPETSNPRDLTVVGGEVFFTAEDALGEIDLWKSDGTESGTVLVFDADANGVYYPTQLTESGGRLFFTADEVGTGYELWTSDGTASGTHLVADINKVQDAFDGPRNLTDVDGTLFFTSYDQYGYNRELWKSDGTAAGTMMVADLYIDPGLDGQFGTADDDASYGSYPYYLTNVNGLLYFVAQDFDGGYELYKSDGTQTGTVQVADLNPTGSSYPEGLTPFNGELFFSATDGVSGRQLYKSDGTAITLVADTTNGLGASNPIDFAVVGGEMFFSANGSVPATTVTANTPLLTDQNTQLSNGFAGIVAETTSAFGGLLSGFNSAVTFNSVSQGGTNEGPGTGWVSSGARIGTAGVSLQSIEVGDLYIQSIGPGELGSNQWEWTISDAAGLTNIAFTGFASGNQMNNETFEGLVFELFLNGSTTATSVLELAGNELDNWFAGRDAANINLAAAGGESVTSATVRLSLGQIDDFGDFQQKLPDGGSEAFLINASLTADLSAATTQVTSAGRELHKTDGTAAGTVMVKDIVPSGSSNPFQLTAAGGKLFFAADDVFGDGLELWVSDGTESGTMQVVDSLPGNDLYGAPRDGAPQLFGALGSQLIFSTSDASQDRELWLSDGTVGGTAELVNINPASGDANVSDLIALGTDVFFVADDGINGEAIWKADTVTGTVSMLADASPANTDNLSKLTVFDEASQKIVFYNNTAGMAGGVYLTDGTGSLTMLSSQRPIELDAEGTMFVVAGDKIYFKTNDGANGVELWVTDGTAQASLVADFVMGTGDSDPADLTAFNGFLFFAATSSDAGRELYASDGVGIYPIADIRTGVDSSSPEQLTVSGGQLYFTADNGSNGRELWRYDGFAPTMISEIRSGANGSFPSALTAIGDGLYFSANNGSTGVEPYYIANNQSVAVSLGNLNAGAGNSDANGFFAALGSVFFTADDGVGGFELWKTDGTAGSAALVTDVLPGAGGSEPELFLDTGQRLLFAANGVVGGDRELWSTDGAAGNAWLVEDLYPTDFFGSMPDDLVEINGTQYFAATTPAAGRELYRMETINPSVSQLVIGGDAGAPVAEVQRSTVDRITLVFDGLIEVPGAAVQLVNRDTNTTLNSVVVGSRYENGQTWIELTFASGPSVIDRDPGGTTGLANSLADGNYQLTLSGALVTSPVSGAVMGTDYQYGTDAADQFFRLFGDTDGDRDVDAQDLGTFRMSFGRAAGSPGYDSDSDRDGDGDVDSRDLGQFRRNLFGGLNFS